MKRPLLGLALASFAASSFAVPPPETAPSTNTLQAIRSAHMPDLQVLEYTGRRKTLREEFTRQLERDGSTIIDDDIGYRTDYEWFNQANHKRYAWNESRAHIGDRTVGHVLISQFRDAYAVSGSSPFFRNLNSNGQRDTQGLSQYSLKESLIGSEYWNEHHPYGWLPHPNWDFLRTTPYLSLESNIGRQPGGLPLANLSLRCSTDFESISDFGQIGISGRAIIPFDHLFQLVAGGTFRPLEQNQRWNAIVRIERWVGPVLISGGGRLNENRASAIFQLSITY